MFFSSLTTLMNGIATDGKRTVFDVLTFCDQANLFLLFLIGITVRTMAEHWWPQNRWLRFRLISTAVLIAFFCRFAIASNGNAMDILLAFLRAIAVQMIAFGLLLLAAPLWELPYSWLMARFKGFRSSVQRRKQKLIQRQEERREARSRQLAEIAARNSKPAVVPRAERLGEAVTLARKNYDLEVRMVEETDLDADEKEVILMNRKQRLLRQLREILES